MSTLALNQTRAFRADYIGEDGPETIVAEVRHDDRCRNGHNTFSITATIYDRHMRRGEEKIKHANGDRLCAAAGGCLHDDIAKRIPELAPFLKWHLTSTDGPMHYIANSMYWAGRRGWCNGEPGGPPNLDHFRSTAVWPEATEDDMRDPDLEGKLRDRLPSLMSDFRRDVESLGFTY